jgi:hypothetical protein
MKIITQFAILLSFLFLASCGDDVTCDANNFNSDVQAQFAKLDNAATVYTQDPTDDNCKKLRKEAEKYLEIVESYGVCTEFDQAQYQTSLQTARDNLNQVQCN